VTNKDINSNMSEVKKTLPKIEKSTETPNKEEEDANESIESMGAIANVGGALFYGILGNLVAAGIPTMFSFIFATLKFVGYILYWIFIKIVPFLVIYVGIPLFILGILLGLLFFGGHLVFLVVFFVGIYFYVRGAFTLRIKTPNSPSSTTASSSTN
jgi:hypothetical protein